MAGHGTHLKKCWITPPPFEAEWQHCHCFRSLNRTMILTEVLSAHYRDEKTPQRLRKQGLSPILPILKLSTAVTVTESIRLLCVLKQLQNWQSACLELHILANFLDYHQLPTSCQDQSKPDWNPRCAAEVQCSVHSDVTAMLIIGIYFWRCAML